MAYQYRQKLSGSDKKLQQRILGADEPSGEVNLESALNWYTRSSDESQRLEWVLEEMKNRGYSTSDVACVNRIGAQSLPSSIGSIARMLSNGCILPEGTEDRWAQKIEEAIAKGRKKSDEVVVVLRARNPAARNRAKANAISADLDELMDKVWERKMKLDEVEFFKVFEELQMKPKQAKVILPRYEAQLAEMTDPDIMHSKDTPLLIKYMTQQVASLKAWSRKKDGEEASIEPKRRGRKPTVGRKPIALTTKLKFKATDEETKLVSIDPRKLVGAEIAVLFNAKYKVLTILRAATSEGLSVKGTTILNADEKTSEAKRAGRRIPAIREMVTGSKTQITKLFNTIESSGAEVRTRTSEDIILVRAI